MRKTKIVCTIGPSSESLENTKKLINAGMNVARLNFSHGDFEEHGNRIKNIRIANAELGTSVAVLLDTKGPEIRLGKLKEEPIELNQGELVTLTTEEILGDRNRVPITYNNLPNDVTIGSTILIDDGLIGLTVEEVNGTEIVCRIVNSGPIKSKKGVNVPGVKISLPGITEKDANDIVFGIEQGGKPVITATQMLDSMQRNPRPTRAEASDVANAIFDGTDAIMLSGETAAGRYPTESVQTMARIAERAEAALEYREIFTKQANAQQVSVTEAISQAVANSALDLGAKAIITSTQSGFTARMVSKYKPKAPIIAVTTDEKVLRRLSLIWGVFAVLGPDADTTDEMFENAVKGGMSTGFLSLGDTVVITAGVPVGRAGTTNLIKIHHIGELLAQGQGIGSQTAIGKIVVARTPQEAIAKTTQGSILVTISTDKEYMPAFEKAGAVITEQGGITSHAAVVGLNLGIPVILGIENATELLQDGMEVTIYGETGVIYHGQSKVL
jgi:pyruvate kinase/phosphohistidine swiveling domain-containing protein